MHADTVGGLEHSACIFARTNLLLHVCRGRGIMRCALPGVICNVLKETEGRNVICMSCGQGAVCFPCL